MAFVTASIYQAVEATRKIGTPYLELCSCLQEHQEGHIAVTCPNQSGNRLVKSLHLVFRWCVATRVMCYDGPHCSQPRGYIELAAWYA